MTTATQWMGCTKHAGASVDPSVPHPISHDQHIQFAIVRADGRVHKRTMFRNMADAIVRDDSLIPDVGPLAIVVEARNVHCQ